MTASDPYSYRSGVLSQGSNVTGYDVEASDGSIGKIDEATYDTSSSYVVVDTGFWIFGKKRLIPAGVVKRVDHDNKNVYVSMTKDEIKNAPDYDPDRHKSEQEKYRRELGDYYVRYTSW
jgi:hypothetical protein